MRRSSPFTAAAAVKICITGGTAEVTGATPSMLDGALGCVTTRFEGGGPSGLRHGRERDRYWKVETDPTVTVPAGLVPRLVAALAAAGLRVDVRDGRLHGVTVGGTEPAARLIGAELAGRLAREPRGLVEAVGRGAFDFASGVALLWPTARVLVAAPNRRQARAAYRQLRWRLRDADTNRRLRSAVGHHRQIDAHTHRVVVTTMPALAHATPDDFEIVVALDAWGATRRPGRDGLVRLGGGRVYGCVPPGAALSRRESLTLEAAFGPLLTAEPVSVSVVMAVPPWSPPVTATGALLRKRAIWTDERRNRFIANVAAAVAERDETALCRLGLVTVLDGPAVVTPRVAVLVESPEHGRLLRKLMPGWPLLTAGMPDMSVPANAIVTLSAAVGMKTFDAGVLVRADGGPGPMRVSGFPLKTTTSSRAVVIDLADDIDTEAVRNTAARIEWYEGRGWTVSGSRRRKL